MEQAIATWTRKDEREQREKRDEPKNYHPEQRTDLELHAGEDDSLLVSA